MKSTQAMYTGRALWICFGRRPPSCDVVACILVLGVTAPDSRVDERLRGNGEENLERIYLNNNTRSS